MFISLYAEKLAFFIAATTAPGEGNPWPPSFDQYTVPFSSVTSKELLLDLPLGFPTTSTSGQAFSISSAAFLKRLK